MIQASFPFQQDWLGKYFPVAPCNIYENCLHNSEELLFFAQWQLDVPAESWVSCPLTVFSQNLSNEPGFQKKILLNQFLLLAMLSANNWMSDVSSVN